MTNDDDKQMHIVAYEYKNDKTRIGAALYFHKVDYEFSLPKLRGDWFWKLQWEECDCYDGDE
jgi:hypothetical protein